MKTRPTTRCPAEAQSTDSILGFWTGRPRNTKTGVPAKAGTHHSVARTVEQWVPAFAGTPTWNNGKGESDGPLAAQIGAGELFLGPAGQGWPHPLERSAQFPGGQQSAGDASRRSGVLLSFERRQ